jgi:Flp pilus assembly protein TadG
MAFLKRLSRLRRDTRGNALALCAAALPLMIGGAGLAIDSVQISLAKRELQRAADSAAMAGAYTTNVNAEATAANRLAEARLSVARDLQVNNDTPLSTPAVVQNSPATGRFAADALAVRVQLRANRSLSFLSFFEATPAALTVEATATTVRDGNFCLLALENSTTVPGITVGGSARINVGCGIATNSRAPAAITATGSSSVTANPVSAVGGIPAGNFNASDRLPNSPVQVDPYARIPAPNPTNCRAPPTNLTALTTTTPGYNSTDRSFCFRGLSITSAVTMNFDEPTILYIDGSGGGNNGGGLTIGPHGSITGRNVTIVLTTTSSNPSSVATFGMNSGSVINMTAPTSGPYAGLLMYEDRRAPFRTTQFNGNSGSVLNGALYFPSGRFYYNGTADMTASCLQMIAKQLDFNSGIIGNTCPANGPTRNFQGSFVRLVA